ncbi:hypothetical protein QUF76_09790 [Desulfobacterales bacterium HSG16]|nr:hypothetical protein [Desulfobacterales bacterium HSG16]
MISVNVQKAARNLPQLVHDTLRNCEETVIVSDTGSVVMVDQVEWENLQETLKLFRDKKSLKALLEGHKARDQGIGPDSVSVDKAFYDL